MDRETRTVAIVIMFETDKDKKEMTYGQFIEMLKREHDMDEILTLSEVNFQN